MNIPSSFLLTLLEFSLHHHGCIYQLGINQIEKLGPKFTFFFCWLVHNRGVNICLARHCYQRSSSHLRTKQISGTTSRETVPNNRAEHGLQSYTKFSKSGFKWMHSSGQQTLEGFNFSTKVNTDSSWCQNKPSGSKITVDYLPKNL